MIGGLESRLSSKEFIRIGNPDYLASGCPAEHPEELILDIS
jgi:hypothetical protein